MQKIARILIFASVFTCIAACAMQKPVSQAPVYNITMTDNSQYVVGDNNIADTKPTATVDQVSKPDVSTTAKDSGGRFYLFLFGFGTGLFVCALGYFLYVKYFKKGGVL